MFRHLATRRFGSTVCELVAFFAARHSRLSAVPRLGETAIHFSIKLQDWNYGTR
jgi:hypothetical protein